MNPENEHNYDDMIDLPHHVSAKHPQMPLLDRAAQFAPFAALTGYEDMIREAAEKAAHSMEEKHSMEEEYSMEEGHFIEEGHSMEEGYIP